LAGLQRRPRAGSHGPLTRYPYAWPGPTPGTNACQTSPSWSRSGICVSAPFSSNRHKVTPSATLEAIEKFVPTLPRCSPGAGPIGWMSPGIASADRASAWAYASGAMRAPGIVAVACSVEEADMAITLPVARPARIILSGWTCSDGGQ
jgi:hypothetical protein